jgi:glutathione peroxidase
MKGWFGYIGQKASEAIGLREAKERGGHMNWSDFNLTSLAGKSFSADQLEGKVVLVVNVASKCGLTPQYKGLQEMYDAHKEAGLVILGVPCNQFLGQEPGTADEIAGFCSTNYGVTFPLLEKQDVNGSTRSPLYSTLVESKEGEGMPIKWNFEKFLVGRTGDILNRFSPKTSPTDSSITEALSKALQT